MPFGSIRIHLFDWDLDLLPEQGKHFLLIGYTIDGPF